ncbi:MAG TPA: glycosyltransferase family 1 protein [Anaerolineae bacterium]|nr:glycosyltransferase family 1 protein [Anaerolineae bacterium]
MSNSTCVGIDASRCRSGGARAHLLGILNNVTPRTYGIERVHIWSFQSLLDTIPDYPWLVKHSPPALRKSLWCQLHWQACRLTDEVKRAGCHILFTADASTLCRFKPQVVLSQDLLSYEPDVLRLFGWGKARLRLLAILWLQNIAFRRADGVIFLTRYAGNVIQQSCGRLPRVAYIPHGVDCSFGQIKRQAMWPRSSERPIRCLYVSNATLYKHQWVVIRAIEMLRNQGIDITLTLVGGGSGEAQRKLVKQMTKSDPDNLFVAQKEFLPYAKLANFLAQSDIFVFASSCEAFGITLLEAMAAGLPIACSNRSCLPELLEDAGVYFDPEDHTSIATAIRKLIDDSLLREGVASKAKHLSLQYSWPRCANETWTFIAETTKRITK